MSISFSQEELILRIKRARQLIRTHRDQKGDDRCWLDDFQVWAFLSDTPAEPKELPAFAEMMEQCRAFYTYRRSATLDETPVEAKQDFRTWDDDLAGLSLEELLGRLVRLEEAIRAHRDVHGRPRTLEDDRRLYAELPEKIPADFRLPPEPEFLGEAKPNVGCRAFWRSHQSCKKEAHDLHHWGPCVK